MYRFSGSLSNRDLKLNLPNSQSENAIKQLKTLTSPLSKFAANLGSALDPRKYGSKVLMAEKKYLREMFSPNLVANQVPKLMAYFFSFILQTVVGEVQSDPLEKEKLQEKWEASNCKTKLIAL